MAPSVQAASALRGCLAFDWWWPAKPSAPPPSRQMSVSACGAFMKRDANQVSQAQDGRAGSSPCNPAEQTALLQDRHDERREILQPCGKKGGMTLNRSGGAGFRTIAACGRQSPRCSQHDVVAAPGGNTQRQLADCEVLAAGKRRQKFGAGCVAGRRSADPAGGPSGAYVSGCGLYAPQEGAMAALRSVPGPVPSAFPRLPSWCDRSRAGIPASRRHHPGGGQSR